MHWTEDFQACDLGNNGSNMSVKEAVQPIKKSSIYEAVIDYLRNYIVENRLEPGDRLPTETSLAKDLNVSRHSVREALKVLESVGIVQSNTRDGTRLRDLSIKPATDLLRFLLDVEQVPMHEIASARQIMECSMMSMIVKNATPEDYQRIEATIVAMEEAESTGKLTPISEADSDFHRALITATNNRAVESYGHMLQEFFHHLRRGITDDSPQHYENSAKEHRGIFEALREGNAELAAERMRDHLEVYDGYPFRTTALQLTDAN